MQRAFFRSANLSAGDLEAADLSEANLAYARLDRANLKGANLQGAVLDYADFKGAVLIDANLGGASLQHAQNLTQAQINDSTCDAATILPPHLVALGRGQASSNRRTDPRHFCQQDSMRRLILATNSSPMRVECLLPLVLVSGQLAPLSTASVDKC